MKSVIKTAFKIMSLVFNYIYLNSDHFLIYNLENLIRVKEDLIFKIYDFDE